MIYKFHPKAAQDIEEAINWYQGISADLPKRFFSELNRYIKIACQYPELFPEQYGCRKINLATFPYLIFNKIQNDFIVIVGVFHGYRRSEFVDEKLSIRQKE